MTSRLRKRARITPAGMIKPGVTVLWYPLHDRTGTPTTGDTFPNGLVANNQTDGISVTTNAVLTLSSGSLSYPSTGGVTFASGVNARFDVAPSGDELTWLQTQLDLSTFEAGEKLVVGCELVTPVGWNPGVTQTILSIGSLTSGSASGGLAFGISSAQRLQFTYWPKSATAATAVAPITEFVQANARNCLVFEIRCVDTDYFQFRGHVSTPTQISSPNWSGEANWATPDSGTGSPSLGTGGIRIGRRNGSSASQMANDTNLRNVWIARVPSELEILGEDCCADMILRANALPVTVRRIVGQYYPDNGPDGNADRTWGVISEDDMFVHADGSTPIADWPRATLEIESYLPNGKADTAGNYVNTIKTDDLPSMHPDYQITADYEGILRQNTSVGGLKFARIKTGTFANSILLSTYKPKDDLPYPKDNSNRGRCQCKWIGTNVSLPWNETLWMALRVYIDWPEPTVGACQYTQVFPGQGGSTGGYPAVTGTLQGSDANHRVGLKGSAVSPTTLADMTAGSTNFDGLPYSAMFQAWHTVVFKFRLDYTASGFLQTFVDDTQYVDYTGRLSYIGPLVSGRAVVNEAHFGIYPSSDYLVPSTIRNNYFSRFFVCRNVGNYSLANIRDALVEAS